MEKNLVGLIALCLVVAGGLYWNWQQTTVIAQQQKKIEELEAKTVASPAPSIDMQEKCAAQAKKSFDEAGWNKGGLPTSNSEWNTANSQPTSYTDHYSSKLNKCFIEVNSPMQSQPGSSTIWTYKVLWDAYEGRTYAAYSWHTVEGKKYWEVPPFECATYPDGTEASQQLCTSEQEFDAFVAKYMGDEQ
jgi:hypothetical protein